MLNAHALTGSMHPGTSPSVTSPPLPTAIAKNTERRAIIFRSHADGTCSQQSHLIKSHSHITALISSSHKSAGFGRGARQGYPQRRRPPIKGKRPLDDAIYRVAYEITATYHRASPRPSKPCLFSTMVFAPSNFSLSIFFPSFFF